MSSGAVERQRGAYAHAHQHEAQLVDDGIRQHAPEVVFDDGVENGEERHGGADVYQQFGAGETTRKRVDGRLGGKDAQENRSGGDRKSTRLNSSHVASSYAVFCLKKKRNTSA